MPSWGSSCFGAFKKGHGFYNKNDSYDFPKSDQTVPCEGRRATSVVELENRVGTILGLTISGGIDKNSRPRIANLKQGSIAHRSDTLAVGDYVLSVNGIRTSKLKHEEIVNLLKNSGSKIVFEVEYEVPLSSDECLSMIGKVIQVSVEKENDSFGFILRGGVSHDQQNSRPLTITHVRFGGPANRAGIIKAGDRLLAVDGINLSTSTLQEALLILKQVEESALLTIEYDVSVVDAVKNAIGPLLVEIDKTPGCSLGITLSCISIPVHAIIIESIRQASIAERCGALHVGDHILAIDNIKIDMMTSVEAMQLLKSCTSDVVKLEILPAIQIASKRTSELSKQGSLASVSKSVSSSIGRADRTEVILSADSKGYGFMLQGPSFLSDAFPVPPIINNIDFGSPAERSGLLQIGDRILAVNGESTEGLLLEDVTRIITDSHSQISLIIEYDVAEAIVPSSGTFTVKLLNGSSDIGITVTAPRNRQFGEPLIISDVKKGSVAYRTGSIQPGDKLLAVNSLRTEHCTVEDVTSVLQSCKDVIKLRIKKDESFSEDPDASSAIVYTVKLIRHGGPLGITVSGTEEPFDPIYISSLTENGLAERTGALHVGDRILAINGISLRGKTLNETICILQTCGDKVTLKISKSPEKLIGASDIKCFHCVPENQMKKFSTPLPSIDSAVDSWDSCNPGTSNCTNHAKNDFYGHSASDGDLSILYQNASNRNFLDDHYSEQNSWEMKTMRSNSFSGSICFPSDDKEESWNKVLEDLQTCGQSQLLRQIEQSILGCDENSKQIKSDFKTDCHTRDLSPTGTISENNIQELNSQIDQLNLKKKLDYSNGIITQAKQREYSVRYSVCNEPRDVLCHPSPIYSAPLPVEIHKVTLFKDQIYEDFGFSLSDGKYENGVYINSIRPGGPADVSGLIKPLDRILQVNNIKTYNAGLIVPLIASSGDRIELIISRPFSHPYY